MVVSDRVVFAAGPIAADGTWMIVEPFASDRPEENHNPVGRVYYSASTMLCVPHSLSRGGPALGGRAAATGGRRLWYLVADVRRRGYPLNQALDFLRILWAIDHGLGSVSKRMLSRLGVTAPQRLVLRMVGRFPGVTACEMAAVLHLDRSTMSGIVTRLVDRGLLVRQADAADRRRVRLEVTARGRRLARETAGTAEEAVRRALAAHPARSVAAARLVLASLAREVSATSTRRPPALSRRARRPPSRTPPG